MLIYLLLYLLQCVCFLSIRLFFESFVFLKVFFEVLFFASTTFQHNNTTLAFDYLSA